MRTKNVKRLWPVPATLAVVAAFLAFGLLATTGAQPAAAQDDPDCTVNVTVPVSGDPEATVADDFETDDSLHCQAKGDTAAVAFTGPTAPGNTVDDEAGKVEVLIQDDSGPIRAYMTGQVEYDDSANNNRYEITSAGAAAGLGTLGDEAPAPMRWRHMEVEIPLPERNAALQHEAQSTIIMVGGDVYIYTAGNALTTEIADAPDADKRNELSLTDAVINIRFLGAPELGTDKDSDFNKKLDDQILAQCYATDDADEEVIDEGTNATACGTGQTPVSPNTDVAESRSKLVVRTVTGENTFSTTTALIDAKTATHALTGSEDEIVIYALVEDAKGNALPETVVDFVADPLPNDIVAARDLSDDPETATVVISGIAGDDEILVGGLQSGDSPPVGGIITVDDAVAAFPLDNLPNGANDSYIITVEVMVGSLSLGTVEIVRAGDPVELKAGVFNIECFDKGDKDDYSDAKFDMDNKGCDASGMASRFGAAEMFVVKSHLEDSRGIVVGVADDMDIELADDFDGPIIDGDPVENDMPVIGKTMPMAWVFTVDEDAMLGDHMITVSTDETNADDEDIDDVMLTVTVAGPPYALSVSGDTNIPLGQSATYIVTATDELGGVPHLTEDENDKVSVNVQPADALVTGADSAGQVKLGADGTAEFTVFASLDADDGDPGRIIVQLGDIQEIQTITFGAPAPEMTAPGMPMNVMATADDMMYNTINVSWEAPASDGNSAITGYMVERGYMDADNMMTWMTVAEMTTDMMYMDTGLMAETKYYYRVTAMNSIGSGMASDGMAMATTGVAPAVPMAYGMLDAVMLTVGDDAHMVDVSGAFMEADGDDVTYTAMSDNDMVATASADGSMVSIMAVGAGSATVTVTATDKDGSATQDISVTVSAAPVASYAIAVPDRIEAGMAGTITVTAQDANGNATAGGTVTVSLSGEDDMVTAIGLANNNELELGSDGEGSFRIFVNADASTGTVTVTVIGVEGVDTANQTVNIGPEMVVPGIPMSVMAEATSHDMITVSWASPADDGGSDITGYSVQRGYMDADNMMMWMDVDPAHMGMDMMYMDTGLMAETTYYYRVATMNSVGMGEYSDGMAMATTMMAPPMPLGDPVVTDAMSNAAGMATIMITPGDNATKHYVWAQPTDLSQQGMYSDEAAGDATMVTFSGLTSGMNYWFIAIAGRGEGDAEEWSAWSGWTAETPIQ